MKTPITYTSLVAIWLVLSAPFSAPFAGRLILDGEDDYAEAVDSPELDLGSQAGESFTLEAWFYMQASSQSPFDRQYIFAKPGAYSRYAIQS